MSTIQPIINVLHDYHHKKRTLSNAEMVSMLKMLKKLTEHKTVINSLIFFFSTLDTLHKKQNSLSPRERQVLYHIGTGSKSADIARILKLSTSTVETHRKNIRKKLKLVGKGKLIEYAIINNLQLQHYPYNHDDEN